MKQTFTKCIIVAFSFLIINSSLADTNSDEQVNTALINFYDTTTQTLTIPKLGVPAGDSGYAYAAQMKLFSLDPLGFTVSSLELSGNIAADEDISALYTASSHSIFFPQVIIVNEDGSQSILSNVNLHLGADPFVWFYQPNTTTEADTTGS